MPKLAQYTLAWVTGNGTYELSDRGNLLTHLPHEDTLWWQTWLTGHNSFSFRGKQGRLTLLKESRKRGDDYWYAYRSLNHQTGKKYAGRTADLTIEHLETIAGMFRETRPVVSSKSLPANRQTRGSETGLEAHAPQAPLLEPKFHAPRLPATLVKRERLFKRLDSGLEQKLTLLSAPAGFGKTTLLCQWLKTRPQLPPVAWISLDSGDNDPVRFWRYVITACQIFHTSLGRASLEQISLSFQSPFTPASLGTALTMLLNEATLLACEGLLVFEDYHVITEPLIHQTITLFLDHLPTTLHIVMLTRSEPPLPLVRWRAKSDLCEIDAADLRFSRAEMVVFFQQNTALAPGDLSQETLAQLDTRLEGWAAGLRLLTLALQRNMKPQDRERVLTTFAGEQRSLQDYFVTEVLSAQPASLQDFLLRTSVLSHLTGPLCDAILERRDSEQMLEIVEHAGLFLELLDGTAKWYRYHALFSEAMRAEARHRFGSDTLSALFRQASQWYERQDMFTEAVESAFQAQDIARASGLIERFLEKKQDLLFNIQLFQGNHGFHTFCRWFEQIPKGMFQVCPVLCIGYATALLFILVTSVNVGEQLPSVSTILKIEEMLRMAEEGFRQIDDIQGLGTVLAFRALIIREQGAVKAAVAYAKQALAYLPEDELGWRGTIFNIIGMGKIVDGELTEARKIFLELCALCEVYGNRAIKRANYALLNIVSFEQGELHQAAAFFRQMLAEARKEGDRDDIAHAQLLLALLSYEWNDLAAAEQSARETLDMSQQLANAEFQTRAILVLARIEHARGQANAALQHCTALLARLPTATPLLRRLVREVRAAQVQFQLENGDLFAARRWLISREQPDEEFYFVYRQREEVLVARCLLALGQVEDALDLLSRLLGQTEQRGYGRVSLEVQVLILLAQSSSGRVQEARQLLQTVLARAHTEGYQRLFLDEGEPMLILLRSILPLLRERHLIAYVQTLLRSSAIQSGTYTLPTEPLSAQEQRVLHLLAAGRSNPEIARELIVSVNTIKAQVQSIYRKLNVNNRVEASEVARLLRLL